MSQPGGEFLPGDFLSVDRMYSTIVEALDASMRNNCIPPELRPDILNELEVKSLRQENCTDAFIDLLLSGLIEISDYDEFRGGTVFIIAGRPDLARYGRRKEGKLS